MDWSDHALWWPDRNCWLTRTRSTLDQCGVQADALLYFTPMHKVLRVQLPDLRYLDMKVDFSVKTFSAVIQLCKELGIRHPEELSFCKPLEPNHLKYNFKVGWLITKFHSVFYDIFFYRIYLKRSIIIMIKMGCIGTDQCICHRIQTHLLLIVVRTEVRVVWIKHLLCAPLSHHKECHRLQHRLAVLGTSVLRYVLKCRYFVY